MKILFVSAASSIHTVKWVNALAKKGHMVYLAFNKGHEPKEKQVDEKVILCPLKYKGGMAYYLNARELKKLENEIRPDVVNVHYASGYGTLARIAGLKNVILSVWGSDVYVFPYESTLKKWVLRKNVKYATMLASTSYCMANQLRKVMSDDSLEIAVTPFGVDLDLFNSYQYKDKASDTILIGVIKALEENYGIENFIRSIDILLKTLYNKSENEMADRIKAEIYGSGSQEMYLRELIKELQLESRIELKGRIENKLVPDALSKFNIFCATSNSESFGVAVVEAMAMAVPVVVTDADGFKEVVVDGKTGFIVPRGDVQKMARKLERLIVDSDMREKFGKEGRKRVEELYDWQKNVEAMENVYNQLER